MELLSVHPPLVMRRLACALIALSLGILARFAFATDELPLTETVRTDVPADLRLIQAAKAYIPELMRARATPGVSLAVARRGKVIWEAGFGYADLEERRPMTPEAVFHFGSISKVYTATAIMQLVGRGEIGLHDPINKYLPFEVQNPNGEREITIYDLLTHRSGLAYGDAALSQLEPGRPLREALELAYKEKYQPAYQHTYTPLWSNKVGELRHYSNLGAATLGLIVEETNPEGLSFSDYVQKHIIDLLGMRFSQFPPFQTRDQLRPEIWKRMATGYARFGAVQVPTPTLYTNGFPAGGAVGVPGDHTRLLLAYMNGGEYAGKRILRRESVERMLQVHTRSQAGELLPLGEQGLIWFVGNRGTPNEMFGHGGSYMYGWGNSAAAYPKLDLAIVVSQNSWGLPRGGEVTGLIQQFLVNWIQTEEPFLTQPVNEGISAWKRSYVMGLILVEAMSGAVGVPTRMNEEVIMESMPRARVAAGASAGTWWDPAGFLAGVHDLQQIDITESSIADFLRSDKIRVSKQELMQVYRELGGIPGSPEDYALPFFLFADPTDR